MPLTSSAEPGVKGEAVDVLFSLSLIQGPHFAENVISPRSRHLPQDLSNAPHRDHCIFEFSPTLYLVFTDKTDDVEWTFQPMRAAETQPNACPCGIFRRIRRVRPKPRISTDS
ncbi:hypothetical protein BELL_0043g00070 [Botrytis elliptica]|uniref:Uncharacterized protein n=1 Tax=Botrytis elliptica TaxID=278938 RepID=A0A4Z1JZZ9_9HELO|nr:hypothetical protein EAE99_011564 [Botrytis elliptica]TGO79098.1 hypothetical protein BELL_0043g00070 [Botrytis elliptica]